MKSLLQSIYNIHHTTQSTTKNILKNQKTKNYKKIPKHTNPNKTTNTNSIKKLKSIKQKNIIQYYILLKKFNLIISTYNLLKTNKRHFIPSLINPFLKITLIPKKKLKKTTIPIFFNIIKSKIKTYKNFQIINHHSNIKHSYIPYTQHI